MFKRVVVAIDWSEQSEHAVETAKDLATYPAARCGSFMSTRSRDSRRMAPARSRQPWALRVANEGRRRCSVSPDAAAS